MMGSEVTMGSIGSKVENVNYGEKIRVWFTNFHLVDNSSKISQQWPCHTTPPKGQQGVKSQSSFSPKLLFLLQITLCSWLDSLDTLYKSYLPGSFGVTGVKRSFSPKLLFLTDYHVTVGIFISTLRVVIKKLSGVITGGQKVIFTKNAFFFYRLHGMVMWHAYSSARYPLQKSV